MRLNYNPKDPPHGLANMIPAWLLKLLHFIGLTNLSDEEVEMYDSLRGSGRRVE